MTYCAVSDGRLVRFERRGCGLGPVACAAIDERREQCDCDGEDEEQAMSIGIGIAISVGSIITDPLRPAVADDAAAPPEAPEATGGNEPGCAEPSRNPSGKSKGDMVTLGEQARGRGDDVTSAPPAEVAP
jgi:hypothetical protein